MPLPPDEFLLFQERTGDSLQVITQDSYASGLPGDKRLFPLTAGAKQELKENSNNAVAVYETISANNGEVTEFSPRLWPASKGLSCKLATP